ncbi:MAG: SGNH/GDSL hydrolase family protein, partial [Candidatus Thiodiazotropha taylori]|nr:SGNH/GDSL hydrolase family protein [Candidatus Thiodiazotropha taylori]MCW4309796.1 SGNH/GDSL hydrolase family protein [Candidatus Thiodiazotropha endolucinida]
NKTTTVYEEIKHQENNIKNSAGIRACVPSEGNTKLAPNKNLNLKQKQRSANPNDPKASTNPAKVEDQLNKVREQQNNRRKQKQNQNKSANLDELIDLTKPTKVTIKQSTLLIGSSILKNIKTSDLTRDTTVRTIPGATIDTVKDKLNNLNIEKCDTIILHVGGNDADRGEDLESFRENFDELIDTVADGTKRVIVSGLLPRESVDLEPFNETLKSLCADNAVEFVDNYDSFLLATGEQADSYYTSDKTHINMAGTRKLLRSINEIHQIIATQRTGDQRKNRSGFNRNHNYVGYKPNHTNNRNSRRSPKYCHICRRGGSHCTDECWYNGRHERTTGHTSW